MTLNHFAITLQILQFAMLFEDGEVFTFYEIKLQERIDFI